MKPFGLQILERPGLMTDVISEAEALELMTVLTSSYSAREIEKALAERADFDKSEFFLDIYSKWAIEKSPLTSKHLPRGLQILARIRGHLESIKTETALEIAICMTSKLMREWIEITLKKHQKKQKKYIETISLKETFERDFSYTESVLSPRYESLEVTERTVRTAVKIALVEGILDKASWAGDGEDVDEIHIFVKPFGGECLEWGDDETEEGRQWNKTMEENPLHPTLDWGSRSGDLYWGESFFKLGIELEGLIGDDPEGYLKGILMKNIPEFFEEQA